MRKRKLYSRDVNDYPNTRRQVCTFLLFSVSSEKNNKLKKLFKIYYLTHYFPHSFAFRLSTTITSAML